MGRALRYVVNVRERELDVLVTPLADGRFRVELEGTQAPPLDVTLLGHRELVAAVDRHVLELREDLAELTVGSERRPILVTSREELSRTRSATQSQASGSVKAPMPGRVVKVLVHPGTRVTKGEGVVVVEAMKMENELVAPISGSVERVLVNAGDAVERGAPLVEIR